MRSTRKSVAYCQLEEDDIAEIEEEQDSANEVNGHARSLARGSDTYAKYMNPISAAMCEHTGDPNLKRGKALTVPIQELAQRYSPYLSTGAVYLVRLI